MQDKPNINMMSLSFLNNYVQVWLLVALIIVIYAAVKATKLVESNWLLWLFSVILAFTFFSSRDAKNYLLDGIPIITLILVLGFFLVLMLVLVAKDLESFKKVIAIASFIIGIGILIFLAFDNFQALSHMLPGTSDSGLSNNAEELKDFLYSTKFKDNFVFFFSVALVSFFILKKK